MNHLTITPVDISVINEIIQSKQLKPTVESGPIKDIFKKNKPERNFNLLLKKFARLSDVLSQPKFSLTNTEICLELASTIQSNIHNLHLKNSRKQ